MQVFEYCVHDECFGIINHSAYLVHTLVRVHQSVMMYVFMTLSIAFITGEGRTTGLRLFKALTEFLLGMGTTVECCHSWGNVPLSMDR